MSLLFLLVFTLDNSMNRVFSATLLSQLGRGRAEARITEETLVISGADFGEEQLSNVLSNNRFKTVISKENTFFPSLNVCLMFK